MHHVTFQPPHGGAKGEITAGCVVRLVKGNAVEIRRQRPDLADFMGRPDQVIAVLPIQAAESANYISNIGTDTKVCTAPDIYGDLHGSDLTTGAHRNSSGITPMGLWGAASDSSLGLSFRAPLGIERESFR